MSESFVIEYTVSRTDETCNMWPFLDQSDQKQVNITFALTSKTSIYYIRTEIVSTS